MNSVFQVVIGVVAAAGIAGMLLVGRRSGKPVALPQLTPPAACCGPEPEEVKPVTLRERILRLPEAIDYLRTRREWRYRTPWVLLLGQHSAGKSSLAASVSPRHLQAPDRRQQALAAAGTTWHFFDKGVLIGAAGLVRAAAPDSPDAKTWSQVLIDINALRPERPLDGLLLAVSARSLRDASTEERRVLAENIRQQLNDLQERVEFALPVYVVVTETDAIDGFSAFWRAQPAARQTEIFGWSVSPQAANGTPEEWTDNAFDTMGERLKALQVLAAAERDQIADVDRFFLFPRHIQQLRAPLKDWLSIAFQASAWQAGCLCRGIYFTGSVAAAGETSGEVRKDVSFVDDLITQQVLAEPNLARPTRKGIWSRNALIKRLQMSGVALFAGLALALAVAAYQLDRQVDALIVSLKMVQEIPVPAPGHSDCIARDRVYALLSQISRIDANSVYWSIPVSWIDARVTRKSARMVAEMAFQKVVMPGLACRLQARATALEAYAPPTEKGGDTEDAYMAARRSLFDFLQSLQTLELNLERFRQLSAYTPRSEKKNLLKSFMELTEYAYGDPLPPRVKRERGALSAALTEVQYADKVQLPAGMHKNFTGQIERLSKTLRHQFDREVHAGSQLLAQLSKGQGAIPPAARHLTRWLTWARTSWLLSTAQANPCKEIGDDLDAVVHSLVGTYHYPAELEQAGTRFSAASCYHPSMQSLSKMHLAPYGPLFMRDKDALMLNPALEPELSGLTALIALDYMQVIKPDTFSCRAGTTSWNPTHTGLAAAYASEYQRFARSLGLPVLGAHAEQRPLYDQLGRRQLELAMNDAMFDAQQRVFSGSAMQHTALEATSRDDQELSQRSSAFSGASASLLSVLRLYGQNGFIDSGSTITECVRNFASDSLGQVDRLAGASRLYDPELGPVDGAIFDLGNTAVTKDYLARQVARSQVLAGYATPFVALLQNTEAVNDAQKTNAETASYWNNTITEINRYVQFKEPNGQIGQLDTLFLKQFAGLSSANCDKALEYTPAEYSNDMFSTRRQKLDEEARAQCSGDREELAGIAYADWATRFNRDLAGRYPFAALSARDAAPGTVRAFFADYDAQRTALRQSVAGLKGERWTEVRRFLDQLDAAAAFFRGTLGTNPSQPITLSASFHPQPAAQLGSEQVVGWSLTVGAKSTGNPNRPTTLDWPFGQPLVFDMAWANQSLWRPAADPQQADLQVTGASASFLAGGEWALLRMIDAHRPKATTATDPLDAARVLLEFTVPLVGIEQPVGKTPTGAARLYLGFNMAGKDPKTQAPLALMLPSAFPRSAPQ